MRGWIKILTTRWVSAPSSFLDIQLPSYLSCFGLAFSDLTQRILVMNELDIILDPRIA